jgi:ribosomal protein L37E
MPRGDGQAHDPFWEEAEDIDFGNLRGTTQYGQSHARGGHIHVCPLCSGPAYSRDHRYCTRCGRTKMARQIREMMQMLEERRRENEKRT